MHRVLLILVLCLSFFCFSQNGYSPGYPTFKNESKSDAPEKKLELLRFKTLDFISETIPKNFTQQHFNSGDSLAINLIYFIDKTGNVPLNRITVTNAADSVKYKFKSILTQLPKFTPAKAQINQRYYDFKSKILAEFYVDSTYNILPIKRKHLKSTEFAIDSVFEEATLIYNELKGKKIRNQILATRIYFSVNDKREIYNIRVRTEHPEIAKSVKAAFNNKLITRRNRKISYRFKKNTNYMLPVSVYIFTKREHYNLFIKTGAISL